VVPVYALNVKLFAPVTARPDSLTMATLTRVSTCMLLTLQQCTRWHRVHLRVDS
jgi:hypothetical protein